MQPHRSQNIPAALVDAEAIAGAASEFGLLLSASQSHALANYAALLQRWNKVHNLTAIETSSKLLTHHLLDSLAIVPEVQRVAAGRSMRVLDVGAGGGLPGIPLAIALPYLHVTLVDKVQKKIAFLTQAKLELALTNVDAVQSRVETLETKLPFELITARAFASLATLVDSTRHLLARNGWWCAMKGTLPSAEFDELRRCIPDVHVTQTVRLKVPRLDAERHLVWMQVAQA
ncbi:MAG: 16S rRNA (guanine(527)-N(7))-methyltransferase RsmG [Burkholderiaceae bacterium]